MSFLGQGLQIGGALAGGASRGIEMGEEEQRRQKQMQLQEENQQRLAGIAKMNALSRSRQLDIEQSKADTYNKAMQASIQPFGPNDLGVPENVPMKYGGAYSGWAKHIAQVKHWEDELSVQWAKLNQQQFFAALDNLNKQRHDAFIAAANAAKEADAADKQLTDPMRTTLLPKDKQQQLELVRSNGRGARNALMQKANELDAKIKAAERIGARRGYFGFDYQHPTQDQPQQPQMQLPQAPPEAGQSVADPEEMQ